VRPGRWILVEGPGLEMPEMQGIGHKGYGNVATQRDGVGRAFASVRVEETIERREIQLCSYRDIWSD
jgi:hypothetical protein